MDGKKGSRRKEEERWRKNKGAGKGGERRKEEVERREVSGRREA